jgi:hypothetical protein
LNTRSEYEFASFEFLIAISVVSCSSGDDSVLEGIQEWMLTSAQMQTKQEILVARRAARKRIPQHIPEHIANVMRKAAEAVQKHEDNFAFAMSESRTEATLLGVIIAFRKVREG